MSDIHVEPGTVEVRGDTAGVAILSVGEGDTKLSFDPSNPEERKKAARIVTEMIRQGYALMVETSPGSKKYTRVKKFDETKCEYIIADQDQGTTDEPTAAPPTKQARGKGKLKRLDAGKTRAVSVGRTAGG